MSNLQTNLTFQKSEPQSTKGMVATKDRFKNIFQVIKL